MRDQIVRTSKDVQEIAIKMGIKCRCKRLPDTNSAGKIGVKMIVGWKNNPNFDVNANPNIAVEEYVGQRKLLEANSKQYVPDIRNIWFRNGMTVEEFTKEYLVGIRNSIPTLSPKMEKKEVIETGKTDEELAMELEEGIETTDNSDEEEDEDYADEADNDEEEADNIGEVEEEIETDEEIINEVKGEKPVDKGDKSDILEAIKAIAGNIETLSQDVNSINDTVMGLENRINIMENKPLKKKTSRKAK